MSRKWVIAMMVLVLITGAVISYQPSTLSWALPTSYPKGKSPAPGTIFLYPERIKLKKDGFFNVERGMMFVPVNRSRKNSDIIAVEVYRFRASEKAQPGTPPIFVLHGGPGFGGLESQLEREGLFEERWQPFLDISDLVVVSQRGIGPSKPTTTIEVTTKPAPLDQPYDEKKAIVEYQHALAEGKAAWEELGLDLKGFTVVEAAADVKDVMMALGYDKLIIWGGSFGSHWGMAVMRYHPEIVVRAIMFGMEGPDHTYDHPGHIWNVYERVAEEAEKAPELQGLIPEGGLMKAIKTVIARVEKKPFKVTVRDSETDASKEVLFDGQSIRRLARGYSRGRLRAWPADVIALYNGDFTEAAETAVRRYKNRGRSFRTASYWMLDCGSGITAKRLAEYEADPAQKIIGSTYWGYAAGCSVWGSDLGDEFRQNFETDTPTVIVHGTWDTSTPYENALELVPYFKNSKFIPVIGGSHGAIRDARRASEKFDKAIYDFVEKGDMAALPDTVKMPPVEWVVPGQTNGSSN
ncbi:alpha/beta hydrolase [bacterium]|nr:alpha/beta hydrolase [bacterium]